MTPMPEPTLGRLLERAAAFPKGVRFIDRHEDARYLTYAELLERARQVSGGLRARGVLPGDRVAIILPTCPEFYDAFFGVTLAGAVPVPLYPPVRLGRLDEYRTQTADLLRECRARLVLSDARTSRVIGRPVAAASPELGLADVGELRGAGGTSGPARHHDVALIQHSSGTTGLPRPVRLTHGAVLANLEAIRGRILAAHPEEDGIEHAAVSWLPLYHDMGLIGCVLTSVAHPVDLTLIPPELFVARPSVWLRAISRYGATVSGAPNFAYSYCAERIEPETVAGLDLSAWRVALTGAEPVTRSALDRFSDRFRPHGFRPEALTPVYGLAEATLAVTFSDPATPVRTRHFDAAALARDGIACEAAGAAGAGTGRSDVVGAAPPVELVSLGRPLDGVRLRIADAGGGEAEEGVLGHVEVGGASLFEGYDDDARRATNPAATSAWFDTGDTGFLLGGELYLYGRAKDVIILRGRKYAPQQIEQSLEGLEGARRGCAAAVGLPLDETGEERLVVLLERTRGASPASDGELAAAARGRVTERTGLVPSRVEVLEPGTLPRTSSGKIRRAEARSRYRAGRLQKPGGTGMLRLAMEVVRSRIALARLPAALRSRDRTRVVLSARAHDVLPVKLSACIIAMNEEDRIGDCLASLAFCDEIVVVDSHSTDGTRDVAAAAGARVIERDWPGHVAQKEFAIRAATNDWVLCLDADERVSPALRAEIVELRACGFPDFAGWSCPRLSHYLGASIRHGTWYPDRKVRLFDRRRGRWGGHDPHDRVVLDGPAGGLNGDLLHYPYRSLSEHVRMMDTYTTTMADGMHARGRRATVLDVLIRPGWRFFRFYVLDRGFMAGWRGLLLAGLAFRYTWLKYAKLRARQRGS